MRVRSLVEKIGELLGEKYGKFNLCQKLFVSDRLSFKREKVKNIANAAFDRFNEDVFNGYAVQVESRT